MKNWFSSSLFVLFCSQAAWADDVADAHACLDTIDVPCAQQIRDKLLASKPNSREVLSLHARTLFHEGRYKEMPAVLKKLEYPEKDAEKSPPYRATISAAQGLLESKQDNIIVRHGNGVEVILADQALETLISSRRVYKDIFGGAPEHELVMDIFPTASRFIDASGLPPEAVRTTGVIALSKWSRLLLTSPRAMSRGYAWKDTAAHEYIHLFVAYLSDDRAPVWLQEGLAKYFEGAWRSSTDHYLSVNQQSLLATALQENSFVPFEKFRYSMAYLDSGEEAALAFAQVSSMIDFLAKKSGKAVFPQLMSRLRDGEDAGSAVASLAGFSSFEEFQEKWKDFIKKLPLVKEKLAELPVALDGDGDSFADDPLLADRQDLARYVRLGDLLLDIQRPKAALVEYKKVKEEDGPPSPVVLARKAHCYRLLKKFNKSLALAKKGVELYPEFPLLLIELAKIYEQKQQTQLAVDTWKRAHDLNPFHPEVQDALIQGYTKLKQLEEAKRHQRYAKILAAGGALSTGE